MSGHRIAGTMSGIEAAIHCGYELLFRVGTEVPERDQNFAINTGRTGPGAHLELNAVECRTQFCSKSHAIMDAERLVMVGILIQQQQQNVIRLEQAVDRRREKRRRDRVVWVSLSSCLLNNNLLGDGCLF
jgi:hypothetical protein